MEAEAGAEFHNRSQFTPWSIYTYAATKAFIVVLLQVGCYVICITCALLFFSFVVECTGCLGGGGAGVRSGVPPLAPTTEHMHPRSGEVYSSARSVGFFLH